MSKRLAVVLALALGGTLATGCKAFSNSLFDCSDKQCPAGGTCQPGTNACSFSDSSCPSGQRYGTVAGDKSNDCVSASSGGSGDDDDGGGGDDDGSDGGTKPPPDAALACYGEGTVIGKICFTTAPTDPLPIDTETTIDTGSSLKCATPVSGGAGYCVVVATDITMTSTLRGTGSKPLVLIASNSITSTADALLDVSSKRSGTTEVGAGHDPTTCTPTTTGAPTKEGGGAGGSFTGKGGKGGDGNGATTGGTPGDAVATVTALQGGCPGQDGAGTPGSGGHGGGAVFLFAVTKIDFQGEINAGGEGGLGGAVGKGGGGGAGAGGMIGFEAPMITVTNGLIANGGGGGEGVSQTGTNAGANGNDATGVAAASGGSGGTGTGGDGGAGSAGPAAGAGTAGGNSSGTAGAGGGGGGGGGAGLIKAPATANLGTSVSPAATLQ